MTDRRVISLDDGKCTSEKIDNRAAKFWIDISSRAVFDLTHFESVGRGLCRTGRLLRFRSCFAQALAAHLEYRELGIFKHFGEGGGDLRWDAFRSLAHGDVANANLS